MYKDKIHNLGRVNRDEQRVMKNVVVSDYSGECEQRTRDDLVNIEKRETMSLSSTVFVSVYWTVGGIKESNRVLK